MIRNKFKNILIKLTLVACVFPLYSQSMQELQKLKSEYDDYKKGQTNLLIPQTGIDNSDINNDLPNRAQISQYNINKIDNDTTIKSLTHFGYDFFNKRDSLSFWENLPTPANYLLGAGDELIISLWGETQLRETYTVNREGKIYDDKVGLLNISGKSVEEAQKYLLGQFGRIYATIKGEAPSTFMDVSLGKLRSININFVGYLNYPGVYPVHPFSNLLTGIIQAGGIDTLGSLRNVKIIRNGNDYNVIDIYDYLLKGRLPKDIQLRDQDIILVPPRLSTVSIDSAVLKPGLYETKLTENLNDLIQYAGGLRAEASGVISIKRIIPLSNRALNSPETNYYYKNIKDSKETSIKDGDVIVAKKIYSTLNQVEIVGQVKNPGKYYFYKGMKLIDLLRLGGGVNDSTFIKSIYYKSGDLVRKNINSRYEDVIRVKLIDVINDKSEDIYLQNLDKFIVHANINFFEKEDIQITGEVNIPGSYTLTKDRESLKSFINRAGGLTSKSLKDGISIYRSREYLNEISLSKFNEQINKDEINSSNEMALEELPINNKISLKADEEWVRVAWQNDNVFLLPGDSIVVKEKTNTVNIMGEIYNPGLLEFQKNKSLRYYINAAGGITQNGSKSKIIVIYANGVVSPKKWYSSPVIKDGSTVIVNKKEFQEPFNITEFATNWTSILSSLITAVILSQQINSGN